MHIENVQKTEGRASAKGFTNLCTFTLVLDVGIKLYGVKLIETPDGNHLAYPPDTASGGKAWWLPDEMRDEVVTLALEAKDGAMLTRFAKLVRL